jgi:hypothetical protein
MPIDFRVLTDHELALCRAWESVDDEDFRDHHEALVAHEAFHPSLNQLFDLRSVTQLDVTVEALRDLARRNPFGSEARRAIVIAPGNPLTFGLARMYQGYAAEDPDRLVVQFDHVEGALDWLGVEPVVLDAMPGP